MRRAPDPGHLTAEEVTQLLRIVHADKAIIVGGQSINIWAEHYAGLDETLTALGPLTSKDIDFYRNSNAAKRLAEALDGKLHIPTADDHTPNAALVEAKLGGRPITIDFMEAVLGVSDKNLCSRYVTLKGRDPGTGGDLDILLMHPLDCVASRLSNINGALHRTDDVALNQMIASVAVIRLFVEEILDAGNFREAQSTLNELAYIIKNKHIGQNTHTRFNIDVVCVLEHFLEDARLDQRWRNLTLRKSIERLKARLQ